MKIGELSEQTGCSVQTIRYYEKQGLLSSGRRTAGNFRLYDHAAVERLIFIKHCRGLDLSLAEIGQLLELKRYPASSCDEINSLVDAHINQVEKRIKELESLKRDLQTLRGLCSPGRVVDQCGILQDLSALHSKEKA